MTKKNKIYLIFTIVYWLTVIIGLVLFGLAFDSVPINSYGLKRNYFNSYIDEQYYLSGLYHKDLGFYFLEFPSSKTYLTDLQINATNKDMKTVGITYTLVYRLLPQKLYLLYEQMSMQYEDRIIAIINSIISNYFTGITQAQSRVNIQSQIVQQINSLFGEKLPILKQSVQIEAFWMNELNFYNAESQYETAFSDASSYSTAYEQIEIELQKVNLNIETLSNLIEIMKDKLGLQIENSRNQKLLSLASQAEYRAAQAKYITAYRSNASQIFEYYPGVKVKFG